MCGVEVRSGGERGREIRTFDALFPNNSYFSEAAAIYPTNLFDINPNISLQLTQRITVQCLWDFMWRTRVDDAIYAPPGVRLVRPEESKVRFTGHAISVACEVEAFDWLRGACAFSCFDAGPGIKAAGGKDLIYLTIWCKLQF